MLNLALKINRISHVVFIRNFYSTLRKEKSKLFEQQVQRNAQKRRLYSEEQVNENLEYLNNILKENKTRNILIYTCESTGSTRVNLLGIVAGFFLIGASYNTWFIFGSERYRGRNLDNEGGVYGSILRTLHSEYFRISICAVTSILGINLNDSCDSQVEYGILKIELFFLKGVMMIATALFFTARTVNRLYLLKGGQSIGLVTDGIFGKNYKYVLNLNETTFSSTRKSRSAQVTFKNKNHYMYFIMNNIDGKFHEKAIFDYVICTKR